jgi:hypothetical protein
MMKSYMKFGGAIAACLTIATAAYAAVTFDPATGTGFVGKGDVQLALGWNNKDLQANGASVEFTYETEVVTEVSWICTNIRNERTQERERNTTTTVSAVVKSLARDGRNQITGFDLTGLDRDSVEINTQSSGQPLNSCPNSSTLTPAGDPEVISSTGGLKVNGKSL